MNIRVHFNRRLRTGQSENGGCEISSAVGGLWEFDKEFQPLVQFLLAKAKAGHVFLGGIDDQLGEWGQDYANAEMVTELTNPLPQQRRQECRALLHKRIYSDEATTYSESDRSQIDSCLAEM